MYLNERRLRLFMWLVAGFVLGAALTDLYLTSSDPWWGVVVQPPVWMAPNVG